MSGLPPIATELQTSPEVRFVPVGDISSGLGRMTASVRFTLSALRPSSRSHAPPHKPDTRAHERNQDRSIESMEDRPQCRIAIPAYSEGIVPCSVELCEAVVAVNDVKRPWQFGQERDCWSPFRSERQARAAMPEVACKL